MLTYIYIFSNLQRQFNYPLRRRSPSPGFSRRSFYDSHTSSRVDTFHRNEHLISSGTNVYRSGYSTGSSWIPSLSPEPYSCSPHAQDMDIKDQPNSWPSPTKSQFGRQERKLIPSSPSAWGRQRRDDTMATRIFEPSDTWKRDHKDRPSRGDGYVEIQGLSSTKC